MRRHMNLSLSLTIFFILSMVLSSTVSRAITNEEIMSHAKKEDHYKQLKQQERYEDLVNAYLEELKSEKERGRLFPQVILLKNICEIYLKNIKNYSLAITYGEEALQSAEKGIAMGPEKEPDDNFYPFLSSMVRKIEGPQYMKREKIHWYHHWKNQIIKLLIDAHRAVGDAKRVAFYERKLSDPESEEYFKKYTEERKQEFLQKLKKQDHLYKEKGIKSEQTAEDHEAFLREVETKEAAGKKWEELMNKQATAGDIVGLRKTLFSIPSFLKVKDDMEAYDEARDPEDHTLRSKISRAELNQIQNRAMNYFHCSLLAYKYNLYQDAFRFSFRTLVNISLAIEGCIQLESKYLKPPYWWDSFYEQFRTESRLRAGLCLNRLARYGDAIPFLKKVYEEKNVFHKLIGLDLGAWDTKYLALYELAQAYEKTGQGAKAVKAYGEVLDHLEGIRGKLTKESHKIGFIAAQREIYDKIIRFLIQEGRVAEAFEYAERAKGRAFLDLIAEKELKPRNKKVEPLLVRKQSLDERLYHFAAQPAKDISHERSVQAALKERDIVIKEIERVDPEFASLIAVRPLSLREVQGLLDKDTALLEYYVDQDGINIWVVTIKGIHAKRVEVPIYRLVKKVADFRESLMRVNGVRGDGVPSKDKSSRVSLEITPSRLKKGEPYHYRVYVENNLPLFLSVDDIVLKIGEWERQAKDILEREVPGGHKKLIYETQNTWGITPGVHQVLLKTDQGILASNALELKANPSGTFTIKDGGHPQERDPSGEKAYSKLSLYDLLVKPVEPYLKKLRIGVIPHGILHHIPFVALNHKRSFVIEEHEIFQLPSASILKFCRKKNKDVKGKVLAIGNPQLKDAGLDIPFSEDEVKAIGRLYPGSKIFTKASASETNFKRNASPFEILHLACHGIFDAESPLDSALLLSPSPYDDGRLTASEIFNLNLNSSLVTISACRSGLAKIRAGDEIMGLPRAFIYAGSPSIVASLWNVSDEATAILMENFYRNLKQKHKAQALRDSQISLMKDARYSHPFFWAPFILVGDYE